MVYAMARKGLQKLKFFMRRILKKDPRKGWEGEKGNRLGGRKGYSQKISQ